MDPDAMDIQFYSRPALGYQVILFARVGKYLGIHPMLWSVIECQYESRYSYPARDEADAREQAVSYCIEAITDHYARVETWDRSYLSLRGSHSRHAIDNHGR